jgi:hypothetical protein
MSNPRVSPESPVRIVERLCEAALQIRGEWEGTSLYQDEHDVMIEAADLIEAQQQRIEKLEQELQLLRARTSHD